MYTIRLTSPPFKSLSSISRSSFLTILSRSISSTSLKKDQTEPNSTDPKPQRERSSRPIHGAIDASSSVRKPISLWPGRYDSPVTNALWEARSSIFERSVDAPAKEVPSQSELLIKTPSQSRTRVVYKFSTDYILREQYRDPWNEVRMGKLLEDLDALAGTIAFKHCSDKDSMTNSLLLVTASVDRIVLKNPLRADTDLKIAGAVTYVGRSSIDIQIEVTQLPPGANYSRATNNHIWEKSQIYHTGLSNPVALSANFTFVARDPETGKSAAVNRLMPETDQEKQLFEEGKTRDKLRKANKDAKTKCRENGSALSFEGEEAESLRNLLARGRVFCDLPALADRDSILLRDTRLENSLVCQPQQRNLHGRIFGGFLMHRAYELAFSTAYVFVGHTPCFVEVDHVEFLKPVDVGDFLRFKSSVLYTQLVDSDQPLINVEVEAHVTRPELRTSEVSNTFYFTFSVDKGALRNGLKIRNVAPATEQEARRILQRMDAENIS